MIRAGAQLDSEFHNQFVEIEDEIGALEEQQVQHESGKKITRIRTAQAGQSNAAGEPVLVKLTDKVAHTCSASGLPLFECL